MATPNPWFEKLKTSAIFAHKTAKTHIGKITETIDKKLKEAQEDLEAQRQKAEENESSTQQKGLRQSSLVNPSDDVLSANNSGQTILSSVLLSQQAPVPTASTPIPRKNKFNKKHDPETSSISSNRNKNFHRENNRNDIVECLNDLIDIILVTNALIDGVASMEILIKNERPDIEDETNSVESEAFTQHDDEYKTTHLHVDENDQDPVDHSPALPLIDNERESIEQIQNDQIDNSEDQLHLEDNTTIKTERIGPQENVNEENQITTSANDLEDSFEEFRMSNTPNTSSVATNKIPEGTMQLKDLRMFLSRIENTSDNEYETLSDIKSPGSTVQTTFKTILGDLGQIEFSEDERSSSPISFTDDKKVTTEAVTLEYEPVTIEKPLVEKQVSIVNSDSIPLGMRINFISCSSTYVYICTSEGRVFYSKLNAENLTASFKWCEHSDLAEQLFVSDTNRTVWRYIGKRLYSANDPIRYPPIGFIWNPVEFDSKQTLLSASVNDECGWFIKSDGTLWLLTKNDDNCQLLNVTCPYNLKKVYCCSEKVVVTTLDGEILVRVGCSKDCLEGDGWVFVVNNLGSIDDISLWRNDNIIIILDKKHQLWMREFSKTTEFYKILLNDDFFMSYQKYMISVNRHLLYLTDCEEKIHVFSNSLTGIQWKVVQKDTNLQRLIGAFSDEDCAWALTTNKLIHATDGRTLEKPRQAQYVTHATFVPDTSSQSTILWSLDESCNIYVRSKIDINAKWEQLDQSQFDWNRRLVHIVCNSSGVWAVDELGYIYFRHGHTSASHSFTSEDISLLPAAWITIPGEANKYRFFSQVYCGPADWMVYATDNKQNVYVRIGINDENPVGISWQTIEDCSALELAVSEHTLWLLTSRGEIQCRENISSCNPIGTRSTTLPGFYLSLTVSMDDSQVWALDSERNLLKLDRLTVLFEK